MWSQAALRSKRIWRRPGIKLAPPDDAHRPYPFIFRRAGCCNQVAIYKATRGLETRRPLRMELGPSLLPRIHYSLKLLSKAVIVETERTPDNSGDAATGTWNYAMKLQRENERRKTTGQALTSNKVFKSALTPSSLLSLFLIAL